MCQEENEVQGLEEVCPMCGGEGEWTEFDQVITCSCKRSDKLDYEANNQDND
jgi:hypothetical protein